MGGTGRRIVRQPRQRIVDALRRERGERLRFAGARVVFAIGDLVVGDGQVGRVEQVAQRNVHQAGGRCLDMGALAKGEMQGDRRGRFRHHHRNLMVADQQGELFLEIVAEEIGPRHGRRVPAGRGDMPIGEPRVDVAETGRLHGDLRIEGPVAAGNRRTLGQRRETIDQEGGVSRVKGGQRIDGGLCIREGLRLKRLGTDEIDGGVEMDSLAHEAL